MKRACGVTVIALLFFVAAIYLIILATIRLLYPGSVPLALAAPLLQGLELSGPYMFLLTAAVALAVAIGLLRLNNFARRAAIFIALAGTVLLVPKLSADAAELSLRLLLAGFAMIVRVVIVWYLWQSWTAENFR
jgi:hypothetical protein